MGRSFNCPGLLDELQRRVLELAGHMLLDGRSALEADCSLFGRTLPGVLSAGSLHWKNSPDCLGAGA